MVRSLDTKLLFDVSSQAVHTYIVHHCTHDSRMQPCFPIVFFTVADADDPYGPRSTQVRSLSCEEFGSCCHLEMGSLFRVEKWTSFWGRNCGHPLWVPTVLVTNVGSILVPHFGVHVLGFKPDLNVLAFRNWFKPNIVIYSLHTTQSTPCNKMYVMTFTCLKLSVYVLSRTSLLYPLLGSLSLLWVVTIYPCMSSIFDTMAWRLDASSIHLFTLQVNTV